MALSIAGGAAQGLEAILEERFKQALEAQRVKEAEAQMQLQRSRLAQDASQFDRTFGETQTQNEFGRNLQAANMAMRGTEFAQGVQDTAADREGDENYRQAQIAMQGTTLANQNNRDEAQRSFTASQNALNRQHDTAMLGQRLDASAAPQQSATSGYSDERSQRVLESVDTLMGKVGNWTAGMGSLLGNIPGSDATNFAAELDTLKANIAFNELAQMREASKTGGALGAVSERELALLESTLGALNARQSPENLRQQLQKVRESVTRWHQAKMGSSSGAGIQVTGAPMAPAGGVRRFNPETGRLE